MKEAAAMFNVSERAVYLAREVRRYGVPELVAAVEAGGLRVSVAALVARLHEDEQRAFLALPEAERRRVVRELRARSGDTPERRLRNAWNAASADERERFLAWIADEPEASP